jgi:hypothetical protein
MDISGSYGGVACCYSNLVQVGHYVAGRIEAKHRFTLMTVNTKCTRLCALSTQGGRKLRSDCTAEGNIEAVNARSEFLWADAGQPRLARTGGISGHRSRGSRLFA